MISEGTRIGPYRIVGKLGEGGMGAVYEAVHTAIERRVAIKTILRERASDQRFVTMFLDEAKLASRIGVATPRTVMLPQKDYIPAIDKNRSLRNLEFPLNWEAIVDYVKFPAILKPADGGGWKDVTVVRTPGELLRAYDASNLNVMTLQEFIDFEDYIRCICIGRERVLTIQYDPKQIGPTGLRGRYIFRDEERWLPKELHERVVNDALKLNHALGYDMNSVEFAVRDGIPYAIDFTNPAPDMHIEHLGERFFNTTTDWMVDFCVRAAKEGRTIRDRYTSWHKMAGEVEPVRWDRGG